eukprot:TRINITY_DN113508_c0_g1_i1.p1 TRINITY_DN113508_c0_g1~~TRINITY_DN113508_c0_g1_i1.p1  ORF type:complete len:162 (+),score=23.55 TRINITY_DN113508_c0_g1_i1:73-486(+)
MGNGESVFGESVLGEFGVHATIENLEKAVRARDVDLVRQLVERGVNVHERLDGGKGTVRDILMAEHTKKLNSISQLLEGIGGKISAQQAQRLFDEQHTTTKALSDALDGKAARTSAKNGYPSLLAGQRVSQKASHAR